MKTLILIFTLVTGYYFHDLSGYGEWWVWNGQTPPQALVYWQNQSGACVVDTLVRSLKSEFPNDPAVDQIVSCN